MCPNDETLDRVTFNQASVGRLHRQTLAEVNVAVHTARRDAAHERVVDVLRHRRTTAEKEQRRALYAFCADMLEEALQCTRRSLVQSDAPVLHYLRILKDTVLATEALVSHEITLTHESEEFVQILDEYLVSQLKTANNVFSDSEMSILGCVEELLKFGRPILKKDTAERLDRFNDDDRRRYAIAEAEYQAYYAKCEAKALVGAVVDQQNPSLRT